MTLTPCEQCQRHVAADAAACPFCAAPRTPEVAPAMGHAVGRFSRAAVFAGLAGCYVNNPPPQQQPPPPPDQQQQQQQQQQQFAQPVGAATIRGTLTRTDGVPGANVRVMLSTGQSRAITTVTDAQGRYSFANVPAGTYTVSFDVAYNPRVGPQPRREVTVAEGAVQQVDMSFAPAPPPDYSNVPKPYGAPPARRRVV